MYDAGKRKKRPTVESERKDITSLCRGNGGRAAHHDDYDADDDEEEEEDEYEDEYY